MAQVKKAEIEKAIVAAAHGLFSEQGYIDTTMAQIAAAAGVSKSNIYVYFPSKLAVLWAICDPWLRQRLDLLSDDVAAIADPRERLAQTLRALWIDIPAEENGLANNIMQAVSTIDDVDGYSRDLLSTVEARVAALIEDCLPPDNGARHAELLSHLFLMAFDGFVINRRLADTTQRTEDLIALSCDLLHRDPPA